MSQYRNEVIIITLPIIPWRSSQWTPYSKRVPAVADALYDYFVDQLEAHCALTYSCVYRQGSLCVDRDLIFDLDELHRGPETLKDLGGYWCPGFVDMLTVQSTYNKDVSPASGWYDLQTIEVEFYDALFDSTLHGDTGLTTAWRYADQGHLPDDTLVDPCVQMNDKQRSYWTVFNETTTTLADLKFVHRF